MTNQEALGLIRQFLQAPNEDELTKLVSTNLPHLDGNFFHVLNLSVEQLQREGKNQAAEALRGLGDKMLRMKTLI